MGRPKTRTLDKKDLLFINIGIDREAGEALRTEAKLFSCGLKAHIRNILRTHLVEGEKWPADKPVF